MHAQRDYTNVKNQKIASPLMMGHMYVGLSASRDTGAKRVSAKVSIIGPYN